VKNISFFIFVVITWVLLGVHFQMRASTFIHPESIAFIFVPQLFLVLLFNKFRNPIPFLKRFLSHTGTENDYSLYDKILAVGFIQSLAGAFLGVIHILGNLSDSTKLGESVAFVMMTLLYGALQTLFFLPGIKSNQARNSLLFSIACCSIVFATVALTFIGLQR
jgi:flagellar motor component MotA